MIISRTPVRVSFIGGGTDFPSFYERFGGEVISTTINKYFYSILTERNDDKVQIISSDLKVIESMDRIKARICEGELKIPMAVMDHLDALGGFNLFMSSEIPPGTGLGSSASVCVNLLHLLGTYHRRIFSKYDLAEQAFHVAARKLKAPVGKQDEYAVAFGGLNHIIFAKEKVSVQPLKIEKEVLEAMERRIMLFFTGSSRDSHDILQEQKKSCSRERGSVVEALKELRDLTGEVRKALETGSLNMFGKILDYSWQQKKKISSKISNSKINETYQCARENGALGGKITGAGGGGFLLLFAERGREEELRRAMAGREIKEMNYLFEFSGAQNIYNDPFFDSDNRGGTKWNFIDLA